VPNSGSSATPTTSRLLLLKAQSAFQFSPGTPRKTIPKVRGKHEYLGAVVRRPEKGWKLIEERIHGHDLPEWFEKQVWAFIHQVENFGLNNLQRNDFSIKNYHETTTFHQVWLDTAGDRPKDIRARRFAGEISPNANSAMVKSLTLAKAPIFRATYHCSQACCRDFEQEDEDEQSERERFESDESDEDVEKSSQDGSASGLDEEVKPKRQRPNKSNRLCDVELHVILCACGFLLYANANCCSWK
jgi:hypothetical protein